MKKGVSIGLFAFVLVLFASFASAGMIISQTGTSYSLGDELALSVTVDSGTSISDFITLGLNCNGTSIDLYRAPMAVTVGEQKKLDLTIKLDRSVIGSAVGTCYISGKFESQEANGNNFEISDAVTLGISNLSGTYNPGSSISLSGTASKKNGQVLEGNIEIKNSDLGLDIVQPVVAGNFAFNFSVPANAKAKSYDILLNAYDKDFEGNVANSGIANSTITVSQVLTSLDVALSNVNISPIENLTYSIVALDQAGDFMNINSDILISSPNDTVANDSAIGSEIKTFVLQTNNTPGTWTITAVSGGLSAAKQFTVMEYKHVSYNLAGSVLRIVNDGNVPYSGPIDIKVGDKIFPKHVDLNVGESQKFALSGDGDYQIQVDDGKSGGMVLGTSFLTGGVIGVDASGNPISWVSWIWVLAILIAGLLIWFYYNRKRRMYYGTSSRSSSSSSSTPSRRMDMGSLTPVKVDEIQNGSREKVAVAIIKIRNAPQLSGNQQFAEVLRRLTDAARGQRADVKRAGDSMTVVFSPILMGDGDAPAMAAEFAKRASVELDSYNKSSGTQAEYGIGINEGELLVEYRGGLFKYMGVSNTLSLARKLADSASKEALMSTNMHALTRAKVGVERAQDGWRITSLKDNSKYQDFLAKFKQRQSSGRDLV